jgi:hypothetical protein
MATAFAPNAVERLFDDKAPPLKLGRKFVSLMNHEKQFVKALVAM